jgi:hypothetical protein
MPGAQLINEAFRHPGGRVNLDEQGWRRSFCCPRTSRAAEEIVEPCGRPIANELPDRWHFPR